MAPLVRTAWPSRHDRSLIVLLVAGAILFAAGMSRLSLGSLDDAFYARKGVEMGRAGGFFTVTWAGSPTFQNPPLQIWIIGLSHRLFGEGDLAARFPSLVMALASLVVTYRIGWRLVGRDAALTAVAFLLMTPLFVEGGRGCMMETPQLLWAALALLIAIEGRERPNLLLLLAVPLAAGILTKSVLGLLPVLVLAGASYSTDYRRLWRSPQLWTGLGVGLLLGSSWTVHQALTIGPEAVRAHYLGEIAGRATSRFSLTDFLFEYLIVLLRDFQVVLIPGAIGVVMMSFSHRGSLRPGTGLLIAWVLVPLIVFNVSSARSSRYIYPILPALALTGGWWLQLAAPRFARLLVSRVTPAVALIVALVFSVSPELLTRDRNRPFKESADTFRQQMIAGDSVPYLGDRYWEIANPLLYYAERRLAQPAATAHEAVATASTREDRLLFVDRDRLPEVTRLGTEADTVLEGPQWVLLKVS